MVFIPKNDGGVRGLGVANLFRRIIGRAIARAALGKRSATLSWLIERGQFGAGAPAGTESLAALVQRTIDDGGAVVIIDRKNAYGLLNEEAVLAWCEGTMPELAPMARVLLADAQVFADTGGEAHAPAYILRGLFQGCALSPLLDLGTIEGLLDANRDDVKRLGVKSAGFLDDGIIAAEKERIGALAEAMGLVDEAAARGGQVMNKGKCCVVCRPEDEHSVKASLLAGLACKAGKDVVGVPVGTNEYIQKRTLEVVSAARDARREIAARLPMQAAFYLLRFADGWPRVQTLFRCAPLLAAGAALEHDKAVEWDFDKLLGPDAQAARERGAPLRETANLPLRLGGHAVASALALSPVAYASAAVQVDCLLNAAFPWQTDTPTPHQAASIQAALFHPRASGCPEYHEWFTTREEEGQLKATAGAPANAF